MADGRAVLDEQIRRLRALPAAMTTGAAPEVARTLQGELEAQVARGQSPDGSSWQATQQGGRPLRNAGAAITTRAIGSTVLATLEGHHARHHLGAVKGGVKRQILPSAKLPDPFVRAITRTLELRFTRAMEAQRR